MKAIGCSTHSSGAASLTLKTYLQGFRTYLQGFRAKPSLETRSKLGSFEAILLMLCEFWDGCTARCTTARSIPSKVAAHQALGCNRLSLDVCTPCICVSSWISCTKLLGKCYAGWFYSCRACFHACVHQFTAFLLKLLSRFCW